MCAERKNLRKEKKEGSCVSESERERERESKSVKQKDCKVKKGKTVEVSFAYAANVCLRENMLAMENV